MKVCVDCERTLSVAEFYADPSTREKYHKKCKRCHNQSSRSNYQKNKVRDLQKKSETRIGKKYGLNWDVYTEMAQNGCSLCGATDARICIDHCHITGKVRGALCAKCNSGLGFFNDDPTALRRAIAYLERDQ